MQISQNTVFPLKYDAKYKLCILVSNANYSFSLEIRRKIQFFVVRKIQIFLKNMTQNTDIAKVAKYKYVAKYNKPSKRLPKQKHCFTYYCFTYRCDVVLTPCTAKNSRSANFMKRYFYVNRVLGESEAHQ